MKNKLLLSGLAFIFVAINIHCSSDDVGSPALIYFQSLRSRNAWSIYSIQSDGTGEVQVIADNNGVEEPAISADRTKMAFNKTVNGIRQIFISNIDGTEEQQLTQSVNNNTDPSFWPDGSKIIFIRQNDRAMVIMTVTLDGTESTISTQQGGGFPAYLDENHILFFGYNGGAKMRVLKFNTGTDAVTDLSSVEADAALAFEFFTPRPSPSGNKIAFVATNETSGTLRELYVMNADGTNVVKLTNRTSDNYDHFRPSWSPDGTQIVFFTNQQNDDTGATWEIYRVDVDGSNLTNLTNNEFKDKNPTWR